MYLNNITTLDQLKAAQEEVRKRLELKRQELSRRTDDLKRSTTTASLIGAAIKTYSDRQNMPYDQNILRLLRIFRRKVEKL